MSSAVVSAYEEAPDRPLVLARLVACCCLDPAEPESGIPAGAGGVWPAAADWPGMTMGEDLPAVLLC